MANMDAGGDDPTMDAGGGGPPPDAGGGGGGPPVPPGGGPMLAALSRSRQQAPVSAPGPGNQADGHVRVGNAVQMLQSAMMMFPAGSPMHTAVLNAIRQLTRQMAHGGQAMVGAQQTQLMDMLRSTVRNALLQKIMMNQQGGGAGGASPGGGGPNPAPNPSMPLPGA